MGRKKDKRAAKLATPPAAVPAALLRPPGVRIVQPEDLTRADLMPYEKADRTPAGPLQMLEEFAAERLELERGRIISMWGEVCERGAVVTFRITTEPGRDETAGWAIVSYEPDAPEDIRVGSLNVARLQVNEHGGKFRVAERKSELGALAAHQRRVSELS